jgi:uncharacterized membrane protein
VFRSAEREGSRKRGLEVRKLVAVLISVGILLTGFSGASAAGISFSDISGHWAEDAIVHWGSYEIVRGYEGKFARTIRSRAAKWR